MEVWSEGEEMEERRIEGAEMRDMREIECRNVEWKLQIKADKLKDDTHDNEEKESDHDHGFDGDTNIQQTEDANFEDDQDGEQDKSETANAKDGQKSESNNISKSSRGRSTSTDTVGILWWLLSCEHGTQKAP